MGQGERVTGRGVCWPTPRTEQALEQRNETTPALADPATASPAAVDALRARVEALERAIRARDDFLAIAAHELRSPLNTLALRLAYLERLALDQAKLADRTAAVIREYAANYKTMTDPVADKLLTEMINIEKDRVKQLETFRPKFAAALPATKLARYYQLEQKIRSVINFELAEKIPLIK